MMLKYWHFKTSLFYYCFVDALVQMNTNALSSPESTTPISVCVRSGIAGTMEVALIVTLSSSIGSAGIYEIKELILDTK